MCNTSNRKGKWQVHHLGLATSQAMNVGRLEQLVMKRSKQRGRNMQVNPGNTGGKTCNSPPGCGSKGTKPLAATCWSLQCERERVCVSVRACTYIHTYIHKYMCIYIYIDRVYVVVCVYIYMYSRHAHTHIYIYVADIDRSFAMCIAS